MKWDNDQRVPDQWFLSLGKEKGTRWSSGIVSEPKWELSFLPSEWCFPIICLSSIFSFSCWWACMMNKQNGLPLIHVSVILFILFQIFLIYAFNENILRIWLYLCFSWDFKNSFLFVGKNIDDKCSMTSAQDIDLFFFFFFWNFLLLFD